MEQKVFDQPVRERGLSIVGFIVESVTLDDESNRKIDDYELAGNTAMQRGKLVGSYGTAVVDAANNPNGAANGLFGVGMMNMASGGMMGGVAQAPFNNQQVAATPIDPFQKPEVKEEQPKEVKQEEKTVKFCSNCGTPVSGKFCSNCGNQIA